MCTRVCCVCNASLGNNGCPCHQITHGYCPTHFDEAMKQVEELENELSGHQQCVQIKSAHSHCQQTRLDSRNNNLVELR